MKLEVSTKMERPRPPTIVPLTTDLIQKILQQQQQRGAQPLASTTSKAAQAGQGTPRPILSQAVLEKSTGGVPAQPGQGAAAINSIEMGNQRHKGQESRAAISVQVLTNNAVNPSGSRGPQTTTVPTYTYKVKIVTPNKRSATIVRYLHDYTRKFESVNGLRVQLMDHFQEQVPATATFDVGYFEGKPPTKIWLVTSQDLTKLYEVYPNGGEVPLWCEGVSETGNSEGRSTGKRSKDAETARRQQQEIEVESAYKELKEKHGETWDMPRLKLWARCIASGIHDDYDNPPIHLLFPVQLLNEPGKSLLVRQLVEQL